jgi:hypothetical protein
VNLDSPDHKSHVAYPVAGPQTFTGNSVGGACPSTHPIHIPQIMLEVCSTFVSTCFSYESRRISTDTSSQIVWDTTKFNNKADWPTDGSQPFVLSTGDTTGYGQHGDYVFGWKADSLQKAMDSTTQCFGAACGGLKTQAIEKANQCSVPKRVIEEQDGCKLLRIQMLWVRRMLTRCRAP